MLSCDDFYYYHNTEYQYFEILTPNYGSFANYSSFAYGNNLNCSWVFNLSPGKRFMVSVDVYSIGINDVLSIYDGNSDTNSFIRKNFTNLYPPYSNSLNINYEFYSDTDIYITFISNDKNSGEGFDIRFSEEDRLN